MSERYTLPPLTPERYTTYYVDDTVNDFFVALKFYLVGIGMTNHRLVENTTGTIKRRLGIGNRTVAYNDIQQLCMTYAVCVFLWDYNVSDWLSFGDVPSCEFRILMFKEGDRYGYVLRNDGTSTADGTGRRRRQTRSARRYSPS